MMNETMTQPTTEVELMKSENASLQGFVMCPYDVLYEIFGEPRHLNLPKVRVEWSGEHKGVRYSIFDWKQTDLPIYDVNDWCIAGGSRQSVEVVKELVENHLGNRSKLETRFDVLINY